MQHFLPSTQTGVSPSVQLIIVPEGQHPLELVEEVEEVDEVDDPEDVLEVELVEEVEPLEDGRH